MHNESSVLELSFTHRNSSKYTVIPPCQPCTTQVLVRSSDPLATNERRSHTSTEAIHRYPTGFFDFASQSSILSHLTEKNHIDFSKKIELKNISYKQSYSRSKFWDFLQDPEGKIFRFCQRPLEKLILHRKCVSKVFYEVL